MIGGAMRRWLKDRGVRSSFDAYYAHIIRAGGAGLPTAREARNDLRQVREWEIWPYSSTVNWDGDWYLRGIMDDEGLWA